MKRFVINVILVLFPVCFLVSLFNRIVDPGHLYGNGGYERQLAKMLIDSKRNVTNVNSNIAERLFKKKLCETYPDSIDVLILGDSQVAEITSKFFPGKRVLNLGVMRATIEDEAALMYTCIHSGLNPSLVVLEVGPFCFNENGRTEELEELQEQYNGYLTEAGQRESAEFGFDWEKWFNLMSFSYFQQGIRKLRVENRQKMAVTDRFENESVTWHYDGSKTYEEDMRKRTIAEVNEIATSYINVRWYDYDEISLKKANSLTTLINYIRSHHAEVIVYLSPFHPIMYDRFMNQHEFHQVKNTALLLDKIVKEEDIQVIGSWNPDFCGCDESDFYDHGHPRVKALDKIWGVIYSNNN